VLIRASFYIFGTPTEGKLPAGLKTGSKLVATSLPAGMGTIGRSTMEEGKGEILRKETSPRLRRVGSLF